MDVSALDIDRYSNAELRTLAYGVKCQLLDDLIGETGRLAGVQMLAIDVLADAEMIFTREPSREHKARVIDAKRNLKKVEVAVRTRSKQASMLQTQVRAPQGYGA